MGQRIKKVRGLREGGGEDNTFYQALPHFPVLTSFLHFYLDNLKHFKSSSDCTVPEVTHLCKPGVIA